MSKFQFKIRQRNGRHYVYIGRNYVGINEEALPRAREVIKELSNRVASGELTKSDAFGELIKISHKEDNKIIKESQLARVIQRAIDQKVLEGDESPFSIYLGDKFGINRFTLEQLKDFFEKFQYDENLKKFYDDNPDLFKALDYFYKDAKTNSIDREAEDGVIQEKIFTDKDIEDVITRLAAQEEDLEIPTSNIFKEYTKIAQVRGRIIRSGRVKNDLYDKMEADRMDELNRIRAKKQSFTNLRDMLKLR